MESYLVIHPVVVGLFQSVLKCQTERPKWPPIVMLLAGVKTDKVFELYFVCSAPRGDQTINLNLLLCMD